MAEIRGARAVTFSADEDVSFLHDVPGVERVSQACRRITVLGTGPLLAQVAASSVNHGIVPGDLEVSRASLEDAYLELTAEDS